MMKKALIVFVKNVVPGKVKTRLAATAGDERACQIYRYLLKHTYSVCQKVQADIFVFYSDYPEENDVHAFSSEVQEGNSLGERMRNAFSVLFSRGYRKLVIIGSDTPEITAEIINEAFERLDEYDLVPGPAADGGYYLLAMKRLQEALFESVPWSTSEVLSRTLAIAAQQNLSYSLLQELRDIDTEDDLRQFDAILTL